MVFPVRYEIPISIHEMLQLLNTLHQSHHRQSVVNPLIRQVFVPLLRQCPGHRTLIKPTGDVDLQQSVYSEELDFYLDEGEQNKLLGGSPSIYFRVLNHI